MLPQLPYPPVDTLTTSLSSMPFTPLYFLDTSIHAGPTTLLSIEWHSRQLLFCAKAKAFETDNVFTCSFSAGLVSAISPAGAGSSVLLLTELFDSVTKFPALAELISGPSQAVSIVEHKTARNRNVCRMEFRNGEKYLNYPWLPVIVNYVDLFLAGTTYFAKPNTNLTSSLISACLTPY